MIRRLLLEDIHLKATALVLSLILFIFVRGDRVSEMGVLVPVIYQLPEDRVLVSEPVKRLRVTLAGRQSKLRELVREGFEPVQVDLTDFTGNVYYFDETILKLDPGVRLLSIQPVKVEVRTEQLIRKEVPVAPNVVGTPDPAFRLVEVSVDPRKVSVEGARSEMRKLTEVKTVPVDVDGRWESTTIEVGLSRPEGGMRYSAPNEKVKVHLTFEPRYEARTFHEVPVEVVNTTWRTRVSPASLRVKLDAPVRLLPGIDAASFRGVVDARDLEGKPAGTKHRLNVELENLPDGVKVLDLQPRKVLVELLQRIPVEERTPVGEGARQPAPGEPALDAPGGPAGAPGAERDPPARAAVRQRPKRGPPAKATVQAGAGEQGSR